MIFNAATLSAYLTRGDPQIKAVLFYGQDEGYIEECRQKATAAVVPDSKDPFRLVDLKPDAVVSDVGSLFAEANAISLMGGRRVVRIRDADKRLGPVMKDFLDTYTGDALIVLTAGSLSKTDALRKVFESSDKAGVFACYADDGEQLRRLVATSLAENGLTATPDVIGMIAENLGADRLVSRSELEKLAAYMGDEKRVTADDVAACIEDASVLSIENFIYELAGGQIEAAQATLERLYAEGQAPIGLLRAVSFHFKKLHVTLSRIEAGESVDGAVKKLMPPLHFKRKDAFMRQLRLWTAEKAAKVLRWLTETERSVKFGEMPQELLCARTFLRIAASVRRS